MASETIDDTDQDVPVTKTPEIDDEEVGREPPESRWDVFKHLGPSFAIVAVTVGSGELIATTAAGARIGIVVLWFLMLSLIVKVGIQYQYSKYGLITGKTPHEIFDEIPGTVFGHSWAWWWMVFFWIVVANLLFMGIFFAAGTMLHYLTGQMLPIWSSLLVVLVITIYPALQGYDFVETFATVIVSGLTVLTIIAAGMSFFTPYDLSVDQIVYGFSFHLPNGGVNALFAAVGITGIAANELVGYAAYVQETGYGSHAGPRDSDGWKERMVGWLDVMKADVGISLLLIIVVTFAFFIIGASVVAGIGDYPNGPKLAVYLAQAYQSLFGLVGYWILLIGGFFALYSTAFGETQLVATVWPDWVADTEWGENIDSQKVATFSAIVMPIIWYIGGYLQGVITPLIVLGGTLFAISYIPEIAAAIWTLRQERNEPEALQTTGIMRIGVWISIIGSTAMVGTLMLLKFGVL